MRDELPPLGKGSLLEPRRFSLAQEERHPSSHAGTTASHHSSLDDWTCPPNVISRCLVAFANLPTMYCCTRYGQWRSCSRRGLAMSASAARHISLLPTTQARTHARTYHDCSHAPRLVELALLTHVAHPSIVIDSMCLPQLLQVGQAGPQSPSDAPHARVRALQAGAVSGQPAVGGSWK